MARKFLLIIGLLVVCVVGVGAVAAQDDSSEDVPPPVFSDGRINSYDASAPVAIFYTIDSRRSIDKEGNPTWYEDGSEMYEEYLTGLELIGIDQDGNTYGLVNLSVDEIQAAVASGQTVFEANGFQLGIGENGWYWLVAPADAEGKVYTYSWDDLGRTLPASEFDEE